MWPSGQYPLSDENPFGPLGDGEMAGDKAFRTVLSKRRKRSDTDQVDSYSAFMDSSMDGKINHIFDELQVICETQEQTNRGMKLFKTVFCIWAKHGGGGRSYKPKSIDLEARSRRNNLIFWEHAENRYENCFDIVRNLINDCRLDLDANGMYLSRAHTLGPRKIGKRVYSRPIIVNFRDFCDTESIMSRAYMLKRTSFSVGYDLPKEINEARKRLWQEVKTIKARRPSAKYQIIYPAKLLVEGKVVRDEFPDWNDAMKGSRLVVNLCI